MSYKLFFKIMSVSLAFTVLCSTFSFTIKKHFCGDVLVDVSVFFDVERCGMEAAEKLQKKSCCKDDVIVVKGQDELLYSSFDDLNFKQKPFVLAFATTTYLNSFKSIPKQIIPYKEYSPPNLSYNIQVLGQVFII